MAQHLEFDDKQQFTTGEHVEYSSQPSLDEESMAISEKALLRKIDFKLVPWLSFLYLLSFLDRSNIGNANLFGLSKHLKLNPTQYGACLAIFFGFYVLFEVPSNMVMKAWRPSMWIPTIMIAWGIVMVGMGFVKDFHGLLIARLFLGITEAGLFPGVSFYLTQWYKRYEINLRIALFFSAATAAGAFGGLLARLINFMDGIAGFHGWRWIFILEGIVTVLAGVASFWVMCDYPSTAKFLTAPEKEAVKTRLALDNDGCSQEYKTKFIKDAFLDWKIWVAAVMFQGALMPVYCFSLFSPTLTANLGYTAATAQLLSVPPYILAAFTTVGAGYWSDKIQKRGIVVIAFASLGLVGFLMLVSNQIHAVNYIGLFLAAAGVYPLIPVVVSWGTNNCGGSLKKGVGAAIIVSVGNAGGIISSFIYPSTDKPKYTKGHAICVAYLGFTIVLALIMTRYYDAQNKQKDERNAARGGAWSEEEKAAFKDAGDKVDWFKYTN